MRLWHQRLIHKLPYNQLIGQHRECCSLRGLGYYKKHSTVQYALNDRFEKLIAYHFLIMDELYVRKPYMNIEPLWFNFTYRGKRHEECSYIPIDDNYVKCLIQKGRSSQLIYSYHDDNYYQVCIDNLKEKQIFIGD